MKVRVEGSRCTGHGRCWTLAPDVYDADDDGFNNMGDTVVTVADGQEAVALRGAQACPEGALTVVE